MTERKPWLWIAVGVLVVVLILLPLAAAGIVAAQSAGYRGDPWETRMPFFSWMPLMGVAMMLFFLLFWVAIIWGAVALWHWLSQRPAGAWPGGGHDAALSALRERYARGEISREEYEERRGVLGG